MVASISARGSVAAASAYYQHMASDEYYTAANEAEGEWAGRGAERLALNGRVTKSGFDAALRGIDPRTGAALTQTRRAHTPGWDMTFSAPKSVSVLWALSPDKDQLKIEAAHRASVNAGLRHLEDHHAFTRRGKNGAVREPVAGLVTAQFHHETSRDLDPQLHTHVFIFNMAPRQDGSWGSLISRDLYKAQKAAGAAYRNHLASELEKQGHVLTRYDNGFRLTAIPRDVERAFSKRRIAIEAAAAEHGYRTPKGMERAALRTRAPKRIRDRATLRATWQQEAKQLGFDLRKSLHRTAQAARPLTRPAAKPRVSVNQQLALIRNLLKAAATNAQSSPHGAPMNVDLHQKKRQKESDRER
jgi:conjugative relaxase-like TrwC/TraI family protein